jgi:kinesin family protein C2/C3
VVGLCPVAALTMDLWSPADDVVLAINCGGSLIENESHGISFKRDDWFTGGDVLRTEEEVTGVHDASLYQTSRYGNVSYVFRDLARGNYVVDLHFAEIIFTNGPPGMRVFDVTVQEEKVCVAGTDPVVFCPGFEVVVS